jgi:hypothetical protein
MDLREIELEGMDRIHATPAKGRCLTPLKTINIRSP